MRRPSIMTTGCTYLRIQTILVVLLNEAKVGTVKRTDDAMTTELRHRPNEETTGNSVFINNGEIVTVVQETDVWCQVSYGKKKGWIKQAYVAC